MMTTQLVFRPPLILKSEAASNEFPITFHVFSASSDKTELYQLRYRAFSKAGWIDNSAEREFSDRYDELSSTFAIGAFHRGSCIGTLRLPLGGSGWPVNSLPCEEQFGEELRKLDPERRLRLVEFSRMAIEPTLTNRSFRTTLYASLVRAGLLLTKAAQNDLVLIAVHRRMSSFYQAMCGFKVIGSSENYAEIDEPTNFMALEVREAERRRLRSNAFFAFSEEEVVSARGALGYDKRHVA